MEKSPPIPALKGAAKPTTAKAMSDLSGSAHADDPRSAVFPRLNKAGRTQTSIRTSAASTPMSICTMEAVPIAINTLERPAPIMPPRLKKP